MALREAIGDFSRAAAGLVAEVAGTFAKATTSDADDTPESGLPEEAEDGPRALLWDPFAVIEQLGYKERPTAVSYGTLRGMVQRMPVVQAVIQTRVNEVAAHAQPQRDRYQLGFAVKARDGTEPSKRDQKWADELELILLNTGVGGGVGERDSLEAMLRKLTWDSLTFDQMCFEVVPDRMGRPAAWYAVDASTIRLADTSRVHLGKDLADEVHTVQIYDGLVVAEYLRDELCFGVRNPRTDIRLHGYGVSEMEMLMTTITSLLYAWTHNTNFFAQGSAQKGILNFKGAIPGKQLRAFRRQWYTMLSGVANAWRTPIVNSEDLQWINMQSTNRDMEFNAWMDFLIKVACAMFLMDPMQVNFKYGNVGQKTGLSEASNREKIIESKERGLRPLLRFIADCLNRYVIWPLNEDFSMHFVGLDSSTREGIADLNAKRVKTFWMVDELRAEDGLDPLPDGKGQVILDPTWAQMSMRADAPPGAPGEDGFDQFGDLEGELGDDKDKPPEPDDDGGDDEDDEDETGAKQPPAPPAPPVKVKKEPAQKSQASRGRGMVVVDLAI